MCDQQAALCYSAKRAGRTVVAQLQLLDTRTYLSRLVTLLNTSQLWNSREKTPSNPLRLLTEEEIPEFVVAALPDQRLWPVADVYSKTLLCNMALHWTLCYHERHFMNFSTIQVLIEGEHLQALQTELGLCDFSTKELKVHLHLSQGRVDVMYEHTQHLWGVWTNTLGGESLEYNVGNEALYNDWLEAKAKWHELRRSLGVDPAFEARDKREAEWSKQQKKKVRVT